MHTLIKVKIKHNVVQLDRQNFHAHSFHKKRAPCNTENSSTESWMKESKVAGQIVLTGTFSSFLNSETEPSDTKGIRDWIEKRFEVR